MGDTLINVNGEDLLVSSCYIEECEFATTVYNFQVGDYHTYFVGECNVWVHNAQCGGSYEDVRKLNKEDNLGKPRKEQMDAHHMPAHDAYPDSIKNKLGTYDNRVNGPSISMDSTDHTKTYSYGRGKAAKEYRAKQKELIEKGNIQEAFNMDVADIKAKFPNKYDSSIDEAKKYLNKLLKEGKVK